MDKMGYEEANGKSPSDFLRAKTSPKWMCDLLLGPHVPCSIQQINETPSAGCHKTRLWSRMQLLGQALSPLIVCCVCFNIEPQDTAWLWYSTLNKAIP